MGDQPEDRGAYVERWLSNREARHPQTRSQQENESEGGNKLTKYYPENRDEPRKLIGLAETGLRDCLPQLDVGDSFELLGKPALLPTTEDQRSSETISNDCVARNDLIDVLSGHAVLMSDSPDAGFAPWSLRYSGHQFGSWAGQLGDGRAISIRKSTVRNYMDKLYLVTRVYYCSCYPAPIRSRLNVRTATQRIRQNPVLSERRRARCTPFFNSRVSCCRGYVPFFPPYCLRPATIFFFNNKSKRNADGEMSTAMHALNIPTTRSLSIISLPSVPVAREREESACIVTRLAPSFIRIGTYALAFTINATPEFVLEQAHSKHSMHRRTCSSLEVVSRKVTGKD